MKPALILAAVMTAMLAGCGPKPLTNDRQRVLDVEAVNALARVQTYEADNGDKSWSDDMVANLERCFLPGFPAGTKVDWGRTQPGPKMAFAFYFLRPDHDGGKITIGDDTTYYIEVQTGRNSLVVADLGDPSVPGVVAVEGFAKGLSGWFKRPLVKPKTC